MRIGSLDRHKQENWLIRAFGIFIVGLTFWILVALSLSSANAGPLSLIVDLSSKLKASYGIDLFGNSMGSLQLSIIEDAWRDGGGPLQDGDDPGDLVAQILGSPVPTATLTGGDTFDQPTQESTHTPDPSLTPISTPSPTFTATATSSPTPTETEVSDTPGGNDNPSQTPSPTPSQTLWPTKTPTSTATETHEPTVTPSPTKTPRPTKTPTPTCTPTPTEPSGTDVPPKETPNDGTPSGPVTPAF